MILKQISELIVGNESHQEMVDLTMIKSFYESVDNEMSPKGERNFTNKRKQKSDSSCMNSAEKKYKSNDTSDMNNEQVILDSFTGRQFKNPNNICYINSVLNGLLALDKYRKKLTEGTCHCELCEFLTYSSVDATRLRIWASRFNLVFKVHRVLRSCAFHSCGFHSCAI